MPGKKMKLFGPLYDFGASIAYSLLQQYGREQANALAQQAVMSITGVQVVAHPDGTPYSFDEKMRLAEAMLAGYCKVKGLEVSATKLGTLIRVAYDGQFDQATSTFVRATKVKGDAVATEEEEAPAEEVENDIPASTNNGEGNHEVTAEVTGRKKHSRERALQSV